MGAILSTAALLLYIGIVTYLPALALEQVTGRLNPSIYTYSKDKVFSGVYKSDSFEYPDKKT